MKKYFLTITLFCLALAGVAATKANGRILQRGYQLDEGTNTCTVDSGLECEGGNRFFIGGNFFALYEFIDFGPCTFNFYKE